MTIKGQFVQWETTGMEAWQDHYTHLLMWAEDGFMECFVKKPDGQLISQWARHAKTNTKG